MILCSNCGADSSSNDHCSECNEKFIELEEKVISCYYCSARERITVGKNNTEPISDSDLAYILCSKCGKEHA